MWTALHMSEMLYLYGTLDDRVRPLVFTVRKWAHELGLTNRSPGRWITNFSLTLLVLAFLQLPAVLPPVNTVLQQQPCPGHVSPNTDSQASLLLQFFDYYATFDFTSRAISLNEAVVVTKPEHSALYIVNPLERALNVSKNVSVEELERLRIELRNAAWTMEQQEQDRQQNGNWGVLTLFVANSYRTNYRAAYVSTPTPPRANTGRMVEVSKLFDTVECSGGKKESQDMRRL